MHSKIAESSSTVRIGWRAIAAAKPVCFVRVAAERADKLRKYPRFLRVALSDTAFFCGSVGRTEIQATGTH
jgi:hypothetical protein